MAIFLDAVSRGIALINEGIGPSLTTSQPSRLSTFFAYVAFKQSRHSRPDLSLLLQLSFLLLLYNYKGAIDSIGSFHQILVVVQ